MAGSPDEKKLASSLWCLMSIHHYEAARNVVAIEELRWQHDHALDEIRFNEALADKIFRIRFLVTPVLLFGLFWLAPEQNPLRHYYDRSTCRLQRLDHMLHPGVVTVVARR